MRITVSKVYILCYYKPNPSYQARCSHPMKILFISNNRIGDAILSTGLLAWLVDKYRDADFTVVAGPAAVPLFTDLPQLERLIPFTKQPWAGHWLSLWRSCIGTRWDLVVDLRGSAIAWLLWTRARAVNRPQSSQEHRVVQLARVLRLATPPDPRIWCGDAHLQAAEKLVPGDGPYLAIGPTANWIGKQWPADRFAELCKRLTAPQGLFPRARIMVFGGPGETAAAQPVLRAIPDGQRIDLVGKLDLLTVYACLRKASLYVGNDSGLMHLAAAAGVPTLGLFGPSKETHYAPWGAHAMPVRGTQTFEDIVGAPGYDYHSGQTYMSALSIERVERAVRELMVRIS